MSCLSLAWVEQLIIWGIVIFAVLALLRLVLGAIAGIPMWPLVTFPGSAASPAPAGLIGFIVAAINIVIWAIIALAIVYICFDLIGCLLSATGGLRLPRH